MINLFRSKMIRVTGCYKMPQTFYILRGLDPSVNNFVSSCKNMIVKTGRTYHIWPGLSCTRKDFITELNCYYDGDWFCCDGHLSEPYEPSKPGVFSGEFLIEDFFWHIQCLYLNRLTVLLQNKHYHCIFEIKSINSTCCNHKIPGLARFNFIKS